MHHDKKFIHIVFLFVFILLAAAVEQQAIAAPAKNIILMISDGQGYNTIQATDYYTGLAPAYHAFPVQYGVTTYSYGGSYNPASAWSDFNYVKSGATDSAAAATAIYTGVKTYDSAISVDYYGNPLTTIAQICDTRGKAAGLVTSVEISHATPAAVWAHNVSRSNYSQIANEMIYTSALDVIMGAGHPQYNNNGVLRSPAGYNYTYVGGEATWNDLAAGTAGGANPWTLIETKADFEALANGTLVLDRVVGVPQVYETLQYYRSWADPSNNNVYVDPFIATVPTLATMAKGALNVLSRDPDGFFLMIEGGAVDWANHNNKIGRMIEEQIDFNNSVQAVIDWVDANSSWGETLLIVTADHETGYLWGPGSGLPATFNPIVDNGASNLPGYQYNSGSHTNSLVPLFAIGSGADLFGGRVDGVDPMRGVYIDNTDIFYVMNTSMVVPEPATFVVPAVALAGLLFVVIKIRKANKEQQKEGPQPPTKHNPNIP